MEALSFDMVKGKLFYYVKIMATFPGKSVSLELCYLPWHQHAAACYEHLSKC